jgi:nitroreductase
MDVMEAIKGRRSIRKYSDKPVSDDVLQTLLEAARWAPSWANTQCWRLIIIRDKETKSRLADTLKGTRPGRPNPTTEAVRNAPVVIAACAERGVSGFYKGEDDKSLPATD